MRRLPHARFECGSRESPGGRVTFFCFAKRKSPKKRRPPVCDPFAVRRGKPASCRLRGAPWNSLCAARAARTATASQFTRHGRFDAHAHPTTATTQAQPAGVGQPNSRTANIHSGHRCARPRLRSAWRLRPRDGAERSAAKQWPAWMSLGFPSGCAWGAQGAGWHARRSARASLTDSPWLSERRAQRKASSTAHPVTEHPRLPRSAAKGSQTAGSPFLW